MSNRVEYTLSLRDLFTNKLREATTATERLDAKVGGLGRTIVGAFGAYQLASFAKSFASSTVDALSNYEYFSSTLRTLMKGDGLAAKALHNQLIEFAKRTPFSLADVQQGTTQLIATGSNVNDITKELTYLGNAAAAVNVPLDRIILNYGQVRAQGVLMGTELRDFTRAGIPLISELAKNLGVAEASIKDMVSEGKVGFKDVEKAFQTMSAEGGQFFNLMEENSKTVGGRLSNLGDAWEQLKVGIGESQRGIIAGTISFAESFVSQMTNAINVTNKLESSFERFGGAQMPLWYKFLDINRALGNMLMFRPMGEGTLTAQFADFQNSLTATYLGASTKEQLQENITKLSNLYKNQGVAAGKGELSDFELINRRAIILGIQEELKGKLSLLEKGVGTSGMDAGLDAGGGTSTGGGSTNIEARRPMNFDIDIQRFGEFTINTTNITESVTDIKDKITAALIEAVNDFQLQAVK